MPIFPKLTPNVTDVAAIAVAAEDAGADAVSLVNTFLAMAIDVDTRRPRLSNVVGGLSGPAIRPIAVRMVYECSNAVRIPIIGMGGIASARDVLEFLIAGATRCRSAPRTSRIPASGPSSARALTDYLERHGHASAGEIVGTVDLVRARNRVGQLMRARTPCCG